MAIVNRDSWLAEHGGGQVGALGPGGEAPDHTPSASPPLRVVDERDAVIKELQGEISLRDGEIARQAELIVRLQAALRAEVERQARAAAAAQAARGQAGAAPRAHVIRKRHQATPAASPPPSKEKPHG